MRPSTSFCGRPNGCSLKWTPDLGPLVKVWGVCSVATDGAINDEITQEIRCGIQDPMGVWIATGALAE
jgi:hypothetical protein